MRSDKELEKELEQFKELTKNQRSLFEGIYGDLFGMENTGHTDPPSKSEKREEKVVDNQREEDSVKKAQDVLKEARKLLESEPLVENASSAQDAQGKPKEPEEDPMEQLEKLVGLGQIKEDVKELTAFVKVQQLRKEQGMKTVPVSLHMVFTGNPGTGKTTVARILARLYKQVGVLSKGQLIEVDRSGLVAGYVGQTAIKTQEQIQKAMGGVLFIDEAYTLAQKEDPFGQEAIDTILKAMEDHRDDFIVIVAGYTKPMEKFINSNPGLKSRFNKYMEFSDYTTDELEQIFQMNCKKYEYVLDETASKQVKQLLALRRMKQQSDFANAREVRNLFEEIVTNQARRVAEMDSPTGEQLREILVEDLMGLSDLQKEQSQEAEDAFGESK